MSPRSVFQVACRPDWHITMPSRSRGGIHPIFCGFRFCGFRSNARCRSRQHRPSTVTPSPRTHYGAPALKSGRCRHACFRPPNQPTLRDRLPSATTATLPIPWPASVQNGQVSGHTGQERSSTSGTGRHRRPADVRPDPRIPENQGGIGHLRLQEITVFPQLQRLSPAPTSGHRVPVSRHSARACVRV